MEVEFTLQSTVCVFAPRAIAVEIGATHFLTRIIHEVEDKKASAC